MKRKGREIVKGEVKGDEENLKWKRKCMNENEPRTFFFFFFFFCLSLFETTEIGLGCTKNQKYLQGENWEIGNFLTSSTFDCTLGYAPGGLHTCHSGLIAGCMKQN